MRKRESTLVILLLTIPAFVSAAAAKAPPEEQHAVVRRDYRNPSLPSLRLTDLKGANRQAPDHKNAWRRFARRIPDMSFSGADFGTPYGIRSKHLFTRHSRDQTILLRPGLEQKAQSRGRVGLNAAAHRGMDGLRTTLKRLSSSYRREVIRIQPVDATPPGPPDTHFIGRRR